MIGGLLSPRRLATSPLSSQLITFKSNALEREPHSSPGPPSFFSRCSQCYAPRGAPIEPRGALGGALGAEIGPVGVGDAAAPGAGVGALRRRAAGAGGRRARRTATRTADSPAGVTSVFPTGTNGAGTSGQPCTRVGQRPRCGRAASCRRPPRAATYFGRSR